MYDEPIAKNMILLAYVHMGFDPELYDLVYDENQKDNDESSFHNRL
jgi:hypothetical protein